MTRITLLSDTHGYVDDTILDYCRNGDEIWHGGDFGTMEVIEQLQSLGKPVRGVYGNVDGGNIRLEFQEVLRFRVEQVNVLMVHIGGYPGRYTPLVKQEFQKAPAQLFISGHSHILKIIYDDKLQCLHMNPGAAGRHGWHKVRTLIQFVVDGAVMKDCRVVELGKRA